MANIRAYINRYPVLAYIILTFVISWGGFIIAVGTEGFPADPKDFERMPLMAILVMLTGPAVSGILMTALVSGKAGFRGLLSRIIRWRVGGRWYAAALLIAPLLFLVVLLPLSLVNPAFQPTVFTSDSLFPLLPMGIAVGIIVGVLEEVGWTGFLIPRLQRRYSVLVTGLIVGMIWGAWHILSNDVWASVATAGDLPLTLFVILRGLDLLVGGLLPFRVLMVWVYTHTDDSLFLAILMHASYAASTFILGPPAISGTPLLIYGFLLAIVTWGVVAVVAMGNGWQLERRTA